VGGRVEDRDGIGGSGQLRCYEVSRYHCAVWDSGKLWGNRLLNFFKMNSQPSAGDVSHTLGVACRPTLVFVVAFALNVTPHKIVHALTGYLLGFNSTVFQMWVNPDAAEAARWQTVLIAGSGPFFSLTVGAVSWLIYKHGFAERPAGLGFLMVSIVGIYSFLGPLAGTALGGDFHIVFTSLNVAATFGYLTSTIGFLLLPIFMYYSGRELFRWVPSEFGRVKVVVCAAVVPWVVGTAILLLVYWPLPRFLIGSMVAGSVFWVFAVLGGALSPSSRRPAETLSSFTRSDLVLSIVALTMVRLLVTGIRLVH
jgi:hypothetical protein